MCVRCFWLVVVTLMCTGCGQPLRIATTPFPTTTAQQPASTATIASAAASETTDAGAEATTSATALVTPTEVMPTETPVPTETPTATPQPTRVPDPAVWLAQQTERQAFAEPRTYTAVAPASLLWYDPITGATVEIGKFVGPFTARAHFVLKGTQTSCLEVPYTVDQDYGLTGISAVVRDRMRLAGTPELVDAFVVQNEIIQPPT